MESLSDIEAIRRLLAAMAIGALIGLEREWFDKPAGLRTYMLVCEGSALFMICSLMLGDLVAQTSGAVYDPSRIASTVVQGIGFIAGGVILITGRKIRGLTTAAGMWVTAAIGLLIGAGFYLIGIVATVVTVLALIGFRSLELHTPLSDKGKDGDEDSSSTPD